MKRETLFVALQVAGFHGDRNAFAQLSMQNHISKENADEQFRIGKEKRFKGVACSCLSCEKEKNLIFERKLPAEDGWQPVRDLPMNSEQWSDEDRQWFEELFTAGIEFVKIGNTMYSRKL